ncbi:WG repeat-containing protein [Flavobacterium sp.]|uniref:WG repeat-containing protein n=1 Tax=Flavobacterium sp. TaxID=239 RepID=UPI0012266607|nr:WG repeat-containing protein [Flavobacterium sp.]RZJ69667.1 MAG: WG repeat-containing protein [Flavobacterium sp.]
MRKFLLFPILLLFGFMAFGQAAPDLKKAHLKKVKSFAVDSCEKLPNGFSKVAFRTGLLASEGIFDRKTKKYLVDAICDSIKIIGENEKLFYRIYVDSLQSLVSGKGKTIVPFDTHTIYEKPIYGKYWLVDSRKNRDANFTAGNFAIYDENGKILLENAQTIRETEIPCKVVSVDKNNLFCLVDLTDGKKALEGYDAIFTRLLGEEQDGSSSVYLVASKNGKYELFTSGNAKIQRIRDFDYLLSDLNVIPNEINVIANLKRNLGDWERERSYNFAVVTKNRRFGIYDFAHRSFVSEAVHDSISPWGNTTIDGKRTNLIYGKPISEPEMYFPKGVVFEQNGKFGVMDASGKIKLDATYDGIQEINQGIFKLRNNRKFGLYFMSENKIVAPKFDHIDRNLSAYRKRTKTNFNRDGTIYEMRKPDRTRFESLDDRDETAFPKWLKYTENGRLFGLADSLSNKITPPIYRNIYAIDSNHFGIVSDSYGMIDTNGKLVLKQEFEEIRRLTPEKNPAFYEASQNGKFGIFDASGKQVFPFSYQFHDYFFQTESEIYTLISDSENPYKKLLRLDKNGVSVLSEDVYSASENPNTIVVFTTKNFKHGFIDLKSGKVVPPEFDNFVFGTNYIIVQKNGKFDAYLDSDFELKPLGQSFDKVISNHWNFIFTQNGKCGILGKDLKIGNFRHDKIEAATTFSAKNYFTERDFEIGSRYLRFWDKPNGGNVGIVDSDSKILIKNDFYDIIEFPVFAEKSQLPPYLEKYRNAFFIGIRNLDKDRILVDLIPLDGKNTIGFEAPVGWKFSLTDISENGRILVRDKGWSIFYDLRSGKIKRAIPEAFLKIDASGGFSTVPTDENSYRNTTQKFSKYAIDGLLLSDTITTVYTARRLFSLQNFIVSKNGKYGIANVRKGLVVPEIYDGIQPLDDRFFVCRKAAFLGLINENGIVQIDFAYDSISRISDSANSSKNSYFLTSKNGKYGLSSQNLKPILREEFDEILVGRKFIAAFKNRQLYAFEPSGKLYWKGDAGNARQDKSSLQGFIDYNNNSAFWPKSGNRIAIETAGERHRYPQQFQSFEITGEKLPDNVKYISRTYESGGYTKMFYITSDGVKSGLSDKNLETILAPKFDQVGQIVESRMVIVANNKFEGVVDFCGKTVIPMIYESVYYDENSELFECVKNGKTTYRTEFDVVVKM